MQPSYRLYRHMVLAMFPLLALAATTHAEQNILTLSIKHAAKEADQGNWGSFLIIVVMIGGSIAAGFALLRPPRAGER